jgi:uncharacterized membrane protein YphA (DoxX/SURF4 family)
MAIAQLYFRTALGLLFLVTGIFKFKDRRVFERAVAAFDVVPARLAPLVAAIVVGVEIGAGVFLAAGELVRLAAIALMVLLMAFNTALTINLLRGRRRLACQCYGQSAVRIGWRHVLENTGLLAVAVFAGFAAGSTEASALPGKSLIMLAATYSAILFLAAQEFAGVRASLVRLFSRIEVE